MSAETLKFFEDKSTESIINWMMTHLTEEQIRMCLDQSGIPDTSLVAEPGPSTSVQEPSVSLQTMLPSVPPPPVQEPQKPRPSAQDIFTDKYRKKCIGTQYLIKKVTKEGVEYFEFKEVEEEDLLGNLDLEIGTGNWVFKIEPISKFKDYCTDEDREILELLKEEYSEAYNKPRPEVVEVAMEYVRNGLQSPFPVGAIRQAPTKPVETPTISPGIIKAIKIQQDATSILETEYPLLSSRGVTTYPVFVYDSDGPRIKHLNVSVEDGRLTLVEDVTNERLLNSKFKKVTKALNDAIINGTYNPPDNIQEEINQAMKRVNPEIPIRIKQIYDKEQIKGYTFFGTLSDDSLSVISDTEQQDIRDREIEDMIKDREMEDMVKEMETINLKIKPKKKPSEMTQEELNRYVIETRGHEYFSQFKPEIYTNALGFKNIRYVKRNYPLSEDFEEVIPPKFIEFQGKPSVNAGPGKFGEELLF